MMKFISALTLFFLLLQIILPMNLARAFESSVPDSTPEMALGEPEVAANPDTPPSARDEEYAERSKKASKFVFSDIPRHLGYDIKESFWGWGSLGLGLGIAAVAGLHQKDQEIQNFTPHALFGSTGDKVINQLGAPYTMAGVGLITAVAGWGFHNEKLQTTGESVLEALFWTELFTIGLQFATDRTRPDGSKRGFPSGHTSGAFSTATVFQVMYGPKVGVPMYALASLVAVSRVDSFKHFASDVLMGAVLGTVIGWGTARYHKKLHQNFALSPDIGPDRYGLVLHHAF